MRILIAEDEAVSRAVLRKAIASDSQHACLVAEDGAHAWALYQTSDVDVVISDWMMPGIDGIELCGRIRASAKEAYPYFIFLTSLEDREHVLTGMRAGADDYLTKPLDVDELRVRLIAAARVTSLHRQLAAQRKELERLNLQLFGQARTDPLTRLGNRLQLWEDLAALHSRAEHSGQSYCLALCDVDCFKRYNDHCGHPAGDKVLRAVARTMAGLCRDGARAYRYGGEEFLILQPQRTPASAVVLINDLRASVRALAIPHPRNAPPGMVTISAGVAAFRPGQSTTADSVVEEADAALYRAKRSGRDRALLYTSATGEEPGWARGGAHG